MSAQISDAVSVDGINYDLCGVRGEGLFEPGSYGIETEAPNTACWRGYVCSYEIRNGHLFLDGLELWTEPSLWTHYRKRLSDLFGRGAPIAGDHPMIDVRDLTFPVPFTGALLLGSGLIGDLYENLGHHPIHAYRNVLELTFESGRLLAKANRSFEMAEARLCECCRCGHRPTEPVR